MVGAPKDHGNRYAEDRSKASGGNGATILAVVDVFSGREAPGREDIGSSGYCTVG